jgi:AcrR family transcriptional regulator
MSETRMPTQKRSIEKRNRIIEKGFELMCEKGFYNTNTTEIAKYAKVSTGIIYQYFNDKKEIFLEGVKNYSNSIMYPLLEALENESVDLDNIGNIISEIIEKLIENHTISQRAHQELVAMEHLDDDVAKVFKKSELETTNRIVELLKYNGIEIENLREKIHIIISIVDNLCHEFVYHKHKELNYEVMKEYVIDIIVNTLNS